MYKSLNKKFLIILSTILSIIISFCSLLSFYPQKTVKADETTLTGSNIIDNVALVGFCKTETTSHGKALGIFFFIPEGYLDQTNYSYGVIVFPNDYFSTYEISKGDYFNQASEKNFSILSNVYDVDSDHIVHYSDFGYLFPFHYSNIKDSNLDRIFYFCFFIKDNISGTYYYADSAAASTSYNGTDNYNFDVNLSDYVSLTDYATLQTERDTLATENSTIKDENEQLNTDLINKQNEYDELKTDYDELIDSIQEDSGIDLSDYVSKTDYNNLQTERDALMTENSTVKEENEQLNTEISELNKQIEALEKDADSNKNNSWGLIIGGVILLSLLSFLIFPPKKKKA